jgi:ubiquinone/menaquinone biosynthesis C-methylase UbiE
MNGKIMSSKWKTKELSTSFLENVRGAIPSAETQIEVILKIISVWNPDIKRVMDFGCGDGILGRFILSKFPFIELSCLDFSDTMLDAARKNIGSMDSVHFMKSDFSFSDWKEPISELGGFDLVVSGFSIHHQQNERKREIYKEIYDLLNPNGIFLNLEHVSSTTKEVEAIFDDYFIDYLCSFHRNANPDTERRIIADKYYNRPDKEENILAPVDIQCGWLREIGYQDVDCFFKVFELALFGGRKIT